MNIEGTIIRLRAVEPNDADLLYAWENDCALWAVSGTTEPFSREQMARFVERQLGGGDLLHTGQLRLMIDTKPTLPSSEKPRTVGTIDLFDYDPVARRAGIGILVYGADDRGRGYASDAVETLCRYAREVLDLHQLWCGVGARNEASLRLFRRTGFVACGTRRDWHRSPEGYEDEVMLQRIL